MSMYDQGKKAAGEGASIARETIRQGEAKAAQSLQAMQDSLYMASDGARALNVKLVEIMRTNAEAFFDFAEQIANAKEPGKLAEIWSSHAQKQMALFSKQGQELAALGQKLTTASVETASKPIR